ncbi:hypothetical protein PoB_003961300 [Plakobranchus ocellatus]|uniref:Uncharacterized protein n=1 Tax=Plakobranchus ocellatus TaxID=259542 RepID=A0AAV4B2Z7_9GAST|nr:hypothetical protein PoB_003961300 [Plakobranchus ocellatus]
MFEVESLSFESETEESLQIQGMFGSPWAIKLSHLTESVGGQWLAPRGAGIFCCGFEPRHWRRGQAEGLKG